MLLGRVLFFKHFQGKGRVFSVAVQKIAQREQSVMVVQNYQKTESPYFLQKEIFTNLDKF